MHTLGKVKLHSFKTDKLSRFFRGFNLKLRKELFRFAKEELSLIHAHGLWMYPNVISRVAAERYDLPLVISPRGMLEPWSRERAKKKKQLAWQLYEKKNIQSARLFHVTAEAEAQSLRDFGIMQPIAVIPNGVHIPSQSEIPERAFINKFSPRFGDKKWILFLSRLDPKKGVDTLLRVWEKVHRNYPDHLLIIAGPDLIGWRKELEKYVFDNRLSDSVVFTGAVQSEFKACLLAHAEFLVLPTHSENFGNVVAEALSFSTPVITTHGAPWEILEKADAGWWIESSEQALEQAMKEALSLHEMTRNQKGQNGRKLVEQEYSWTKIAQDFDLLYRWILSGKEKTCICAI